MNLVLLAMLLQAATAEEPTSVDPQLDEVLESVQISIPARQIKRDAPSYPSSELRRGREAWVHVAYCIDESGEIRNASVLDSIGSDRFDQAAIDTVKRWKFEPALYNGEPAWQSRNQVLITFQIDADTKAASGKFVRRYKKIGKLIDAHKLDAADDLFSDTYANFDLSLYELSKLWAQRARIEGLRGDAYRTDMALHRATASHGDWIDEKSYHALLTARIKLEVSLGKYYEADHSFRDLLESAGPEAEEVVELQPIIDKLRILIDSDNVLQINAQVRSKDDCNFCDDSWDFTPVRNEFTLQNVEGTLESIEMRCDNKRFESKVGEDLQWQIPASWGKCHVQFYGKPGTTFDVLLLPPAKS